MTLLSVAGAIGIYLNLNIGQRIHELLYIMCEITFVRKWTQSCDLFHFLIFPIKSPIEAAPDSLQEVQWIGSGDSEYTELLSIGISLSLPQGEFRNNNSMVQGSS